LRNSFGISVLVGATVAIEPHSGIRQRKRLRRFSDQLFWTPAFVYFRILIVTLGAGFLAIAFLKQDASGKWSIGSFAAGVAIIFMLVAVGMAFISPDKWGIAAVEPESRQR